MNISDEKLNQLADHFLENQTGKLLDITFETYLNHTAYYDELVDALNCGNGLRLSEAGGLLAVEIGNTY